MHTFGSTGTLAINGLTVHHVDPSEITEDKRIRVVLFKENLSVGWDCPRAETMMSFRRAEDATYIAQLLGRMVRTPLQCHILVDDSLNDVRLYLPYFNRNTVKEVVDELQSTEGGEIPTVLDGESLENPVYVPWSVRPPKQKKVLTENPNQLGIFSDAESESGETAHTVPSFGSEDGRVSNALSQQESTVMVPVKPLVSPFVNSEITPIVGEPTLPSMLIDREAITKFINDQGYLTYLVRNVKINNYLKSLLNLAGLLTRSSIYAGANNEIETEVLAMVCEYIEGLHTDGTYKELAEKVLSFKLSVRIFDVFGESLDNGLAHDFFTASESDLDRQLRAADARLGAYGFPYKYGRAYGNLQNPSQYKIDCILFAADEECIGKLNRYAEEKFHGLNDRYRRYVVAASDRIKKQYSSIIADGDIVSKHNFALPETITARLEEDGKEYSNHLFADENGIAKIKKNNPDNRQLLISTHSEDFLQGLLDADNENVTVIRINRVDNVNKMSVLRNDKIKELWSRPLLRYSNILSGLFHEKVIVCESDYDCLFYQAIIDAICEHKGEISPDVLFTHCGGKTRIKDVVRALKAVNVPVVAIYDFDVVHPPGEFKSIIEAFGMDWDTMLSADMKIIYDYMNAKKVSGNNKIKGIGKAGLTGNASEAYERVEGMCKAAGLFIVPVGEMECFDKTIKTKKKEWVYDVLERNDLATAPQLEEARMFVQAIID